MTDTDNLAALNQTYKNLMEDETSDSMICGTISNSGIPYDEEDFEETLRHFKEGQEYFHRIYFTL